jgi:hypothetical protein
MTQSAVSALFVLHCIFTRCTQAQSPSMPAEQPEKFPPCFDPGTRNIEGTEAYLHRNDFHLLVRAEFKEHDLRFDQFLGVVWKPAR